MLGMQFGLFILFKFDTVHCLSIGNVLIQSNLYYYLSYWHSSYINQQSKQPSFLCAMSNQLCFLCFHYFLHVMLDWILLSEWCLCAKMPIRDIPVSC